MDLTELPPPLSEDGSKKKRGLVRKLSSKVCFKLAQTAMRAALPASQPA